VGHNAFSMVASGSLPRRTSLHPALAVLAVVLGVALMTFAGRAVAPHGLRSALAAAEIALALPGIVLLALSGVPVAAGLGLTRVPGRTMMLAALAGGTLWAASLGLMNMQFVIWRPPPAFLDSFRALHLALRPANAADAVLSVIAIAVMPAVCEETLFRGVVLPSFARAGAAAGLVGSATLFALIHIDSVASQAVFYRLPFAFAVGLGLATLRLLTGSLVASMAAHAVLNTITFGTVFLTGAASQAMEEPEAFSGSVLLLAGAAATAFLFRAVRR
jgi:sodium transport system permease protein